VFEGFWLAFDDLAGLDAACADAHALTDAVHLGLYRLKVYVPATPGGVMGVGDVITELRAFAAEITFSCHKKTPICVAETYPVVEPLSSNRAQGHFGRGANCVPNLCLVKGNLSSNQHTMTWFITSIGVDSAAPKRNETSQCGWTNNFQRAKT
jgi:hypothetical protein